MTKAEQERYETRVRIHALGKQQGYLTAEQAMEAFRAGSAHQMVGDALERAADSASACFSRQVG